MAACASAFRTHSMTQPASSAQQCKAPEASPQPAPQSTANKEDNDRVVCSCEGQPCQPEGAEAGPAPSALPTSAADVRAQALEMILLQSVAREVAEDALRATAGAPVEGHAEQCALDF